MVIMELKLSSKSHNSVSLSHVVPSSGVPDTLVIPKIVITFTANFGNPDYYCSFLYCGATYQYIPTVGV